MSTPTPETAYCADRWTCPYPGCHVAGQTQRGHESETDLSAHQHVVHPDTTQPADRSTP